MAEDVAHLYISYDGLRRVLKLPEGVEIIGLDQKPEEAENEIFRLLIKSPEFVLLEAHEEDGVKRIKPRYNVYEEDGHRRADFGGFIDMVAEDGEDGEG